MKSNPSAVLFGRRAPHFSTGFHIPSNERLGVLRGRIDLERLVLDGGLPTSMVPCVHHPRSGDALLNQVLMAELRLAASMTLLAELRQESLPLPSRMEGEVSRIRLDAGVIDQAARQ